MSLINCPECDKQISDKAEICVGCGAPVVLSYIIGKTTIIPAEFARDGGIYKGRLEIAERDFIESMNWNEANKKCNEIGYGWRLPTKWELEQITLYRLERFGLSWISTYWSSNEQWLDLSNFPDNIFKYDYAYYINFFSYGGNYFARLDLKKERHRVRAVRTLY
jgi:hypothetical protein